jgi:hypothetical protein
VNAAQAAQDWATMRDALQSLSDLEGFGPQARNPQGSQTVANLLDLANDRLEQAAQTPTATSIPPSPTAVPPTPTATDIPQPPTTVPLPTATDEPLPTATDEPLPTATEEPLPTATDEPLPTVTPTEGVVYETYTYPSNLFSMDVPQDWSSQDESEPGSGLARVDFQAPQDAYGLSVRVSALPADAPGQEQLLRDFLQDEFGDNTDFAIEDQTETRPNGQLSLGFSYRETPFIGTSFVVPGRVVGQINGDKLSLLVVLYTGGEDERTPERVDIINTMLDSYTIDPAVALPS